MAVKVLVADAADHVETRHGFRREIQALAKLDHPGIAAIADYGELTADDAAEGPETFSEGAPWFAMEYVDGQSMDRQVADGDWQRLARYLRMTLDALAHAHARSIIHRDLKPSNILVTAGDGESTAKLVDFGIARLFDEVDGEKGFGTSTRVTGTPKYMAPEQIQGEWRDQGPWTDLYALGCMVWRIVCGSAPFVGETTDETLNQQMSELPPDFEPIMAVPEGLEEWLRGLLRKQPLRRPRRAADAAWALEQLGDPIDSQTTPPPSEQPDLDCQPTLTASTTISDDVSRSARGDTVETDGGSTSFRPAPLPSDWRRVGDERTTAPMPEAGLKLFGLREVPLVDRDDERERMWGALQRAASQRKPRLVTLEAGPGRGKTRLAQWLMRRTHELGAANGLHATHTPGNNPDEGLRGMVRRAFRTAGLDRGAVFDRLLQQLPPLRDGDFRVSDARALTELLRPTDDEEVEGPQYRFSNPEQKFSLMRRLFARMSHERPALVWFDDLQWGRDAIGVLEDLFSFGGQGHPMLVVATVRTDVVANQPGLAERLDSVWETADADRCELASLGSKDHRALIDRLLPLDRDLADEVADRTEGNPLFAIQLLRDWVDRGRLQASDGRYRLVDRASTEVPDDIHRLWLRRLEQLVGTFPDERTDALWQALEIAGTLGRDVNLEEWRAVCERCDIEVDTRLIDRLVKHGLADRTETGWTFTHGLLVESLQRRADRKGRERDHHRHCARMLERRDADYSHSTAARRADHWERAGDLERALDPLWEEAERLKRTGSSERACDVLEHRGALYDGLGVSPSHADRIENELQRATATVHAGGQPDQCLSTARRARELAGEDGSDDLVRKSWTLALQCHRVMGPFDQAQAAARRAVDCAREIGDDETLADTLMASGWVWYQSGELERAEAQFSEARERADAAGARYRKLQAIRLLGHLENSRGAFDRARERFDEVLEESREYGYRGVEATCLNGLGEVARFQGDIERARQHYREFGDIAVEHGRRADRALSILNRSYLDVMEGAFGSARQRLEEVERLLEILSAQGSWISDLVRVTRLTCAAGTGEGAEFDRLFEPYADGWPDDAVLERDTPWLFEMAGDYAADNGHPARADRAWRLAGDLWRELGEDDAADRADDKHND